MQKIIEYFKTLGVDANTTATILITLFTFSIGLLLTWVARQLKQLKEKRSYKKSLILILKDFSKACNKQDQVVNKSLGTVGFKEGNDFIISFIPIGTLDYLNKLDFNIFLQNFEPFLFKKHFSKAISKLFELIAQIRIQNETISDFTKMFSENYARHEKQYFENIDELRKIHDNFGVHLNGKQLDKDKGGDLVQGYFKIFGEWERKGADRNFKSTHQDIILKILELTKNHQSVPMILQINEYALKCDIAFVNIEKIDKLLRNKFRQFAHFHRRASKLINVIIKIIK